MTPRSAGAERRAAPKPARIPLGAEAGRERSSGVFAPAEGLRQKPRRGLQGRRLAYSPARGRGFTLIEAAFVLVVLGIVLTAAVPAYRDYLARQRLRHVAELLELDLRRARTMSVDEGHNIYVSFGSGPQWCWGASRQAPCDCTTGQPRCELSGVTYREHKGLLLQAGQSVTFEAGMGRAQGWTRIGLSNDLNQQLHLDLNPLGRPQICGTDARKGGC